MAGNEQMKQLVDNLWRYFEPKIEEKMRSSIRYYRAEVTANPGGNRLTVQRPFDTAVTIPCVDCMAGTAAGDQVLVMVFGGGTNANNSVVVGDGALHLLGGAQVKLLLTRSQGWASGASVRIPELANCDAALVFYCNGTGWSTTALRHVIVPVGTIGVLESVVNFNAASYLTMVQRQITVASNGTVTVGEVWLKPVNSNAAATDNTSYPYAISPYKIYGVKW